MTRTALAAAALALATGAALVWTSGAPAWASSPSAGELGTEECRDLQLEVGEELSDGARGRRGELRQALRMVLPRLLDGEVSGACSACILRDVARRMRSGRTESCGPDRLCGDGELDPGEDCDDGNSDESDGCTSQCRAPECGGIATVVMCEADEFCEFPRGSCGPAGSVLPTGICVELRAVCICPRVLDPVCGCDGVSYSNDCQRRCAATSLAHPGACACGAATCPPGESCCDPLRGSCLPPGRSCPLR